MAEPESWELGDEFVAVRALSPVARDDHFIGRVTDWGWVWLLGDDSEMALVEDPDEGVRYMPVWPHAGYADVERERSWERYEVIGLSLDEWMERLLPALERDSIRVGVSGLGCRRAGARSRRSFARRSASVSRPTTARTSRFANDGVA